MLVLLVKSMRLFFLIIVVYVRKRMVSSMVIINLWSEMSFF